MSSAKPKSPGTTGRGSAEQPPTGPQASDASVEIMRRLIRGAGRGVLSTRLAAGDGWPYGSLVLVGVEHDLSPILLLSDLAEHTRNIAADPRASLLIDGTVGHDDPLSAPRVALMGLVARIEDRSAQARYIAHHPAAALYAGFSDFHFFRLTIERAHLVAGFGRISWLEADQIRPPLPAALIRDERKLVDGLNQDAGLVRRLALKAGADTDAGWKIAGLDRDGLNLCQRGKLLRLWFDRPAETTEEALASLDHALHPGTR
jgi:putative heme iron utilization protein